MADEARRWYGIQFHPEVVHTPNGRDVLRHFALDICKATPSWQASSFVTESIARIKSQVGAGKVICGLSGGVDSAVAALLIHRAIGDNLTCVFVDNGLLRLNEAEQVVRTFRDQLGLKLIHVDASAEFLGALEGVSDPERKRKIIGEKFVQIQEEILESGPYMDGNWILGQGTIYPDTIESGGTAKADLIKTHHNRVAGIQKLIEENRIVEPLTQFYKDEVRELGVELGLPAEFLERHPFPGPGLAIRCLCADKDEPCLATDHGTIAPIHSVGVQGDSRSYRPVLVVDHLDLLAFE
jgi:GMP synthase (glutamine-hydrolysing)